jgi:hypothetical protein
MKITVHPLAENALTLMRRAGYVFQRHEGGEMSFVRELGRGGYPRFHAYTRVEKLTLSLNLHLDQKKHTYGEGTRHHGEYSGGAVAEEGRRLLSFFGENASIDTE